MGANKKYTAQEVIDVIPGSGGIVATIAKRLDCRWNTAQSYIKDFATVQAAYNDECEMVNDKAESVIMSDINDGSIESSKWWISRKRPEKFSPQQNVQHSGNVIVNWDDDDND